MKKILLSILTVLAVGTTKADEKAWYLQTDTNAKVALEKVDYLLAADDDDHFTVVVKMGTPIAGVKSVSFSQQATGLEAVEAGKPGIVLPTKTSSSLTLTGLASGTAVRIYSVDGRLVKEVTASDQSLKISVSDLANGTYILRTQNSDVKFVKQ